MNKYNGYLTKSDYSLYLFFFSLLSLIALSSNLMLEGHPFYYSKYMHLAYIQSAENLFLFKEEPFTWRILQPLIINLIPFDKIISFFFISFLSLYFSTILIFKSIFIVLNERKFAILGAIIFLSIVWGVRFNIIEFWYPESLLYFFISLFFYGFYSKRKMLMVVALILGILTKETMLIFFPFYYTATMVNTVFKRFDKKLFVENLVIVLPALFVLVIVRILISNDGGVSHAYYWINEVLWHRILTLIGLKTSLQYNIIENQPWIMTISINWYRYTIGAFGGFFLVILLTWKANSKIFLSYLVPLTLIYLQLFIAYDIERLLTIAFFPFILLTVNTFTVLVKRYKISFGYFAAYSSSLYLIQILYRNNFYFETFYAVFTQSILSILFVLFMLIKIKFSNNTALPT